MPYIKKQKRNEILEKDDPFGDGTIFHHIIAEHIETPGDLNYAISVLVGLYVKYKGMSYTNASEALTAMDGAKLEFYRRVLAPYEDKKIKENGDVYPPEILTDE